ncbi:MAG: hypothetical protein AB7N24_19755 [Dehalococcoidia bacterium]
MKHIWMAPVIALWLISPACGGGDDSGGTAGADESPTVQKVTTAGASTTDALKLGDTADFNGLKVRIVSWQRKSPTELGGRNPTAPEEGWLIVQVETENTTASNTTPPELSLICADGTGHTRYADDSTDALKSGDLSAKSKASGTMLFGTPPNCFPATILGTPVTQAGGKPAAQSWRLQ